MKHFKYILLLSFIIVLLTACNKDNIVENVINEGLFYGYEIIDYDTFMRYNVEYKESRKNLISNLYFNEILLPNDIKDNKFFIPLSLDKNNWESGSITFNEENISLYFVKSTNNIFENVDKKEIIANNQLFIMIALDNENNTYTVYRLIFTGLPIMTIKNKDEVIEADYPIRSSNSDAFMRLYNNNQTVVESDVLIHARGGSSRSFPKIGYKVNLVDEFGKEQHINLLNMREDDDWVLIPMYSDESMIRDKLSYDLWSEYAATNNNYGIHNGPQAEYIELFINDTYWGLYMLVVPVDRKQQNLSDDEILCKIEDWIVPSVNSLKRGGNQEAIDSITVKKPDDVTQSTWTTVAELVDLWFEMPKDKFIENAPKIIDIDNVIDYWILLNLTKGKDNAWKNMYLTWKLNPNSTYTVLISPWDCDLSWGVMWKSEESLLWEYTFYLSEEILDFRLGNNILRYNVGNSVNKLKTKWNSLRKGILKEENLFNRIDELTNLIHDTGAWNRDLKRWPYAGHADDKNEYLKEFTTAVFNHMDKYIENLG